MKKLLFFIVLIGVFFSCSDKKDEKIPIASEDWGIITNIFKYPTEFGKYRVEISTREHTNCHPHFKRDTTCSKFVFMTNTRYCIGDTIYIKGK